MTKLDNDIAQLFKLLSNPARVQIVRMLKGRVLCVGALSRNLDMTQSAVSQHLRALRDGGLVVADKRGYFVHYRLNDKMVGRLRGALDAIV